MLSYLYNKDANEWKTKYGGNNADKAESLLLELARDLNVRLNGIELIVAKQPKLAIEATNRLLKQHNQIMKEQWQVFCVGSLYLAGNILFELGMADFEQLTI